jgi:hypothetical protein
MHDIKYFFSIEIIRQFRWGKKKIQKRQITESIIKKYYFSKFRRGTCLLDHLGSAPDNDAPKTNKIGLKTPTPSTVASFGSYSHGLKRVKSGPICL